MNNTKTKNLIELINQNPGLEVVPIVNCESNEYYSYWLGSFCYSEVNKIYINDERYYLYDDCEELIDEYISKRYDGTQNDEELLRLEEEAEKAVKNYDWKEVIVVYITTT